MSASKSVTQTTRDALEIQLNKNLLTLAIEFLGNPDRGMDFFDQSIYRPAGDTLEQIRQISNVVAAGGANTEGELDEGAVQANITVLSGGAIEFGITQDGTTFIGDTIVVEAADGTVEFAFEDVPPGVNLILIKNLNGTEASGYQVEIYA